MHLEKNLETLSEQILCLTARKQAKMDPYALVFYTPNWHVCLKSLL